MIEIIDDSLVDDPLLLSSLRFDLMPRNQCYLSKEGIEALNQLIIFITGEEDPPITTLKNFSKLDGETIQKILKGSASNAVWENSLEKIFDNLSENIDKSKYQGETELLPSFYQEVKKLNSKEKYQEIESFNLEISKTISLQMVKIIGGKFRMGAQTTEEESYDNERPLHDVSLKSFHIGKYPVTIAQWRIVARWELVDKYIDENPNEFLNENQPVQGVTWEDAVEFCKRLSSYAHKTYRLPTEAEWEFSCRGGTETPFHFGETIRPNHANYNCSHTYKDSPIGQVYGRTTEVGKFKANNFGLYDMHGNIWEMCSDTWHSSYDGAPKDGSAWIDESSACHVVRGGSCIAYPGRCRSASRDYNTLPQGFRVVCDSIDKT